MYLREMELQLLSYYFLLLSYVKLIITDQLYIFNILPVNHFFLYHYTQRIIKLYASE